MALLQCAIGAYFKSTEALKIGNLYWTLAFLEAKADELKGWSSSLLSRLLFPVTPRPLNGLQCQIKEAYTLILIKPQ